MPKYIYVEHTPDSLNKMAKTMEEQAQLLRGVAASMKTDGLEKISVTNGDQRKRGLMFVESFISAARNAVLESREPKDAPAEIASTGRPTKPRDRTK